MSALKRITLATAAATLSILTLSPLAVPVARAASHESSPVPGGTVRVSPARFGEFAVHAVRLGMTQGDVTSLIGKPNGTSVPHRGGVAWDYDYVDTWGYASVFTVAFDGEGVVVDKASARRRY